MAYQRRTVDEYQLQGLFNGEWEEVTSSVTHFGASEHLREYRENDPRPYRIKKVRIPISNFSAHELEAMKKDKKKERAAWLERMRKKRIAKQNTKHIINHIKGAGPQCRKNLHLWIRDQLEGEPVDVLKMALLSELYEYEEDGETYITTKCQDPR